MKAGRESTALAHSLPVAGGWARGAFTLMELLLVLLIIVIAGAVAMPLIRNSLKAQQLKSAAETMRIEWSRAHVKAMKTGRIQVFRYELNGRQFAVEPWVAADEATEAAPGESTAAFGADPAATAELQDEFATKSLEEGVTFAGGEAKFDSRAYEVEDFFQNGGSGDAVQWSQPILFYPDGSASDAFVIVTDDSQSAYRINLRGLTGTSYVSEIAKLEDLLNEAQESEVLP